MPTRDEVQAEAIEAIMGRWEEGDESTVLQMPTQCGKAQPEDSNVLTPFGWCPMGETQVGMSVMGSDGKPYSITGVFPQGEKDVYRVTFSDGASVECCGEHLWKVRDRRLDVRRVGPDRQWKVYPTSFLMENMTTADGNWRWSVPMVKPIEFPGQALPIDPYTLGVLIGDGCLASRAVGLSNPEPQIREMVTSSLPVGLALKTKKEGIDYYISSGAIGRPNFVRRALKSLGLMGRRSYEKHIPHQYRFASVSDRIALLQGLLDTDGSTSKFSVEYSTSSPQLAEDVRFLVESLGGRSTLKPRTTFFTHKGERKSGRTSYRMLITLPAGIEPFRLDRKKERYRPKTKYQPHRSVVSIEKVGRKECRCISVDAPDSLYVTDHCVVTHNTRTVCKMIERTLAEGMPRWIVQVHLGELINQWGDELTARRIPFVVEKSNQRAIDKMRMLNDVRVCLASQPSLKGARLTDIPRDFFTHVALDECHLSVAPSWIASADHFQAKKVGVSATIDRLDGVPLGTQYDSMAYVYPITKAIANGHRAPFRSVQCEVPVDMRGLKPKDVAAFGTAEVAARLMPKLEPIARVFAEHIERKGIRKWIAFLPNRQCSLGFANLMTALGHSSRHVDYESPDRVSVIRSHKAGDYEGLCNFKLLGMGYSDPEIQAVLLLQPTNSRAWLDQMAGRSGATHPDKEFAYLLYPRWIADIDLMGPTDIFSGDMNARVRQKARKINEDREESDPEDVLEEAQREIDREDADREEEIEDTRQRALRYHVEPGKFDHVWKEFDPLARFGIVRALVPQEALQPVAHDASRATEGQARVIRGYGLDPEGMTAHAAGLLAEKLMARDLANMADGRDVQALMKLCGLTPEAAMGYTKDGAATRIRLELSRRNLRRSRPA